MFTTTSFRHLIWGALVLGASQAQGQVTTGANSGAVTDFLGWDNTVTNNFPLQVRHDLNQPIDFFTNNSQRMRLNPTQNNTINGFTIATDGFLGLGRTPIGNTAPGTPWTRLHLHDADAGAGVVTLGFRDWMRNGITFTGNADQGYIGQEHNGTDTTDMVTLPSDKQRLRRPRSETAVG